MKVFLIVHGFVQGVGYRSLVKRIADRHGVRGMVKNAGDGSVHVLADGNGESLSRFEKEINMSIKNGPSVHHVERFLEADDGFPKGSRNYDSFIIEK